MDTFTAVVFDSEEQAFKGSEALNDLQRSGDIVVYSSAIIAKDADGKVSMKQGTDEGPIGTAFGMLTGAMIGLLAGPAAVVAGSAAAASAAAGGMAFGSVTGGMFGMFRDLYEAGIDADVLDKVNSGLEPGKTALVASIDEVWTTPLDVKMKEAGGTVHRKARIDIIDEQIARDIAAEEADLRQLNEEWEAADEEARKWVKEKIGAGKAKMKELNQKTMDRLIKLDDEFNARQAALDKQILDAVVGAKEKLEKRKAELKADYEERKEKLKKAGELARSALT